MLFAREYQVFEIVQVPSVRNAAHVSAQPVRTANESSLVERIREGRFPTFVFFVVLDNREMLSASSGL